MEQALVIQKILLREREREGEKGRERNRKREKEKERERERERDKKKQRDNKYESILSPPNPLPGHCEGVPKVTLSLLTMGVFGCRPTLEILPPLKVAVPLTAYTKNLETLREMSSGLLEVRVRMKLKLVNPLLWEILVARRSLLASA